MGSFCVSLEGIVPAGRSKPCHQVPVSGDFPIYCANCPKNISNDEIYLGVIYILYTAGGGGSPRGRQSGSLNWRKTVFHCGKMEIFHVVLFIVDVFQIRIIFFRPSKLKSIMDHHNMFFWCSYFLHWNYEVHTLCYIKDHWKRV